MDDIPNFQVENIIQKMKKIKKTKIKKKNIPNNFNNIEEFDVLDNLIKTKTNEESNEESNDPLIEGLEVNRENYNGWDWVKDPVSSGEGLSTKAMYKFLTRILGYVTSTIYYATVSQEKQIETYLVHAKDIAIIRNVIVWIISAMLCIHFTNNWMYVLFESKCDGKELWNIYESVTRVDYSVPKGSPELPLKIKIINTIKQIANFGARYELMIIYSILIAIQYIPTGLHYIKDTINDTTRLFNNPPTAKYYGNIIYYITFFIVYIISIICTKYSIKWFSDFVESFLPPMTFFKNIGIMTLYAIFTGLFCYRFYEEPPIPMSPLGPNAIYVALTIVAFIMLYACLVVISVPIGGIFAALWLLTISLVGRYMCIATDPVPKCPDIPADGDVPKTEITYHLIKALHDNALKVVILIILFVSLREFNLKLSDELSVITDVSIKQLYIGFLCLLILAFGTMFYSKIRLVAHEWYVETEAK